VQGGRYTTIKRLLGFAAVVVLFTGDALAARGLTTLNLTCRYAREETTFVLSIVFTDAKVGRVSAQRAGGVSDGWAYQGVADKVLIRLMRIDADKPKNTSRININRGTGDFEEITVTEQGVPPLTLGGTCQKTPDAKF
jgi:hypothetical protein